MATKIIFPKLNDNLVIDNTLSNDVLDINWSNWTTATSTSKFKLNIVKLESRFARHALMQHIRNEYHFHNSEEILTDTFQPSIISEPHFDARPAIPDFNRPEKNPFENGTPVWSKEFSKDTRAVRIQLSKCAAELDGEFLGFTLKSCDECDLVRDQAQMIILFAHTPYFSCSPTSSAANFIRKESFRWPLSMLEKFNKIPCSDIKTVVNDYKAVYFAMSLISSSPYDWDSTNKIKDDCYCFEYDNNAYLISKEFWLLYEIMLDTKNSQTDEKLHDQGWSNLAVKLLEDQLEDIWNRKYFYKVESIPAAVLKWESFPNADSYSVQRFSKKRDCLCPIVKNQKATTCEDLNYNDTIHYELNTGTKVYKYECAPSLSPIVV